MSEDPTQDLEQKYDTRPMLENLLKEMRGGFAAMNARFDGVEVRLDRVESELSSLKRKVQILSINTIQRSRGRSKDHRQGRGFIS